MYTVIILDGHLASFSLPSLIQENAEIPASRNLPPFPIWTSMVSSTINACRIIWDLIDNAKITVLVSGNSPEVIVKWNKHRDDRLSQMQKAFQEYRPKKINNGKRMQKIFEKSLDLILGNTDQDVITSRILYIATGEEDTGFK
ncbi:hypothetical protein BJ944DRAFT_243671 [Cunninghamella echinulata]|nr:hypothetical protein BJ944DRAFT_243671 [Cunninghamella echinulata]